MPNLNTKEKEAVKSEAIISAMLFTENEISRIQEAQKEIIHPALKEFNKVQISKLQSYFKIYESMLKGD